MPPRRATRRPKLHRGHYDAQGRYTRNVYSYKTSYPSRGLRMKEKLGYKTRDNNMWIVSASKLLSSKTPLKDRFRCKLVYSEDTGVTANAGVNTFGSTASYRLNSLHDPRYAAGGNQPYGYDQIAALYNKYIVYGAKVEATFLANSGSMLNCALQIQQPNDTNDLTGKTIGFASELPGVVIKPLYGNGEGRCTIVCYVPIHKALGVRRQAVLLDPDNYGAVVSTGPTIIPYAKVALSNAASAGTAPTATVNIKITYYAEFFERVPLNES
jgi:hypothetical protein